MYVCICIVGLMSTICYLETHLYRYAYCSFVIHTLLQHQIKKKGLGLTVFQGIHTYLEGLINKFKQEIKAKCGWMLIHGRK